MEKEYLLALKSMVFAQAFVDTLDEMQGTSAFKQGLKHKAKKFNVEVEKFLDAAYCGGETDSNVLHLLEECQSTVEHFIESKVEFE